MRQIVYLGLLACTFLLSACDMNSRRSATELLSPSTSSLSEIDWSKAGPDAQKYQIDFEEVRIAVASGAKFYDVRTAKEYEEANFGITENFPITDLQAGTLPELDKDVPIYIHCLKGLRSAQATKILREAGFTHVYDMGGLEQVQAIGGQLTR